MKQSAIATYAGLIKDGHKKEANFFDIYFDIYGIWLLQPIELSPLMKAFAQMQKVQNF